MAAFCKSYYGIDLLRDRQTNRKADIKNFSSLKDEPQLDVITTSKSTE